MKTITKHFAGILLALLCAHPQGAMAQATAGTEDALLTLLKDGYTQLKLGQDITLTKGRLDIYGKTITLDLNGHTLTRPMTAADQNGQVIAVMNGGQLTITDSSGNNSGTITGGWAYQGAGIYVYEGCLLTISGGTITGNRSDQIAGGGYGFGGGVENHGTMTITGGNITGNTAGQFGGGIYQAGTLNIQGNPVIDDLYFVESHFAILTGALTTGASIGISAQKTDQEYFTQNYLVYHSGTSPDTFFSSNVDERVIRLSLNGEVIIGLQSVEYIERAWDEKAKKVTETKKVCTSYTPINGNDSTDTGWMPLYDGWYVVTGNSFYKAFNVVGNDVKIILPDGVTLKTRHVKLVSGKKLSIYGQGGDAGLLNVDNAYSYVSSCAAIGGGEGEECGIVVIHGGTINASSYGGAGIGGGPGKGFALDARLGGLTIYGGNITAEGGDGGAGIGSSNSCKDCAGYITIYGGKIDAKGESHITMWGLSEVYVAAGAGIGGGDESPGGIVHIWGGEVKAEGDMKAAGIGGGYRGAGVKTHIHGGTVTAIGCTGAGIGCGGDGKVDAGEIIIDGGTVNASTIYINEGSGFYDFAHAAAIGCGEKGTGANITINGGYVYAICHDYGTGIGGGSDNDADLNITITGGTVIADGYIGIGAGKSREFKGSINISGGSINAQGVFSAFGSDKNTAEAANMITLPPTVMVNAGTDATSAEGPFPADQRLPALIYRKFAEILPCQHSGATFTVSGTTAGDTHKMQCAYCTTAFLPERHTFVDGTCSVCGVGGQACAITMYVPATMGTLSGYEAVQLQMVPGSVYKLPGTGVTLSGREFAGWLVGYPQNENDFVATSTETLLPQGTDYTITNSVELTARYRYLDVSLANDADNGETLYKYNDMTTHSVTLTGRTLWKDGAWNTLCLPFALGDSNTDDNLTFTGTPLEGATVKTLSSTAFDSKTGTLTLNFSTDDLTAIEAGKPYIVKWAAGDANIENPVFSGVTIVNTTSDVVTDELSFRGLYAPLAIKGEDRSLLYLDADNTLCYPSGAMTIGAFRCYFELAEGLTAGDPASGIRTFVLNFDGEETGIGEINASNPSNPSNLSNASNLWFTLDGSCLNGKPAQRGLYIHNGRKVLIK